MLKETRTPVVASEPLVSLLVKGSFLIPSTVLIVTYTEVPHAIHIICQNRSVSRSQAVVPHNDLQGPDDFVQFLFVVETTGQFLLELIQFEIGAVQSSLVASEGSGNGCHVI